MGVTFEENGQGGGQAGGGGGENRSILQQESGYGGGGERGAGYAAAAYEGGAEYGVGVEEGEDDIELVDLGHGAGNSSYEDVDAEDSVIGIEDDEEVLFFLPRSLVSEFSVCLRCVCVCCWVRGRRCCVLTCTYLWFRIFMV